MRQNRDNVDNSIVYLLQDYYIWQHRRRLICYIKTTCGCDRIWPVTVFRYMVQVDSFEWCEAMNYEFNSINHSFNDSFTDSPRKQVCPMQVVLDDNVSSQRFVWRWGWQAKKSNQHTTVLISNCWLQHFVLQYQNMLMHHVYCSRKLPGIARQCKSAISVETVITKSKQVPAAASSESLYQTHSQPIWPGNPVHPFLRLLHISIPLLVGDFNPSEKY